MRSKSGTGWPAALRIAGGLATVLAGVQEHVAKRGAGHVLKRLTARVLVAEVLVEAGRG
jgi:hypothetical protein